jgi:hypothetical protein
MSTHRRTRRNIIVFSIIALFVGLGVYHLYSMGIPPNDTTPLNLDQAYRQAIEDAMVAKESEVYTNLTSIVENNSNLIWQGQNVLMVTWTKYASSYPVNGTVTTSWGDTWVTAAPQIKIFFQTHVAPETNLTTRAAELLGLPANVSDTYFVEFWVNPQSLFRPTPDNEITDSTTQLTFPSNASADYKAWFNNNIINSYYPMKYPWTRLGYTYDWGNSQTHVGLSEFVLKQNSTVTVKSVTPNLEYLKNTP